MEEKKDVAYFKGDMKMVTQPDIPVKVCFDKQHAENVLVVGKCRTCHRTSLSAYEIQHWYDLLT